MRKQAAPRYQGSSRSGATAVLVAVGFLALISVATVADALPRLILGVYVGVSAIAYAAYYLDKSAARNNRWRTQESTLHLLALVGGWPGALLAQQVLKHKSQKQSFREIMWLTVVLNCAGLGWLISPYGASVMSLITMQHGR